MAVTRSDDFSYLDRSLTFKIRKLARYVALDGVSKTLAKVRAQYHMTRTESFEGKRWTNPACRTPDDPARFVGIIGCGKFGHSMISHYVYGFEPKFLRGAYDIDRCRSLSLCRDYYGAYAAGTPEGLIDDPKIRLVYIASNHASHAEYAIQCLDAGKSVHIEKPHVISEDQLARLLDAQARNPRSMVFLGFNRPRSPHFSRVMAVLSSQPGPLSINCFVVGHAIPSDNWYFNPGEGGRVLGNLCHWTDLTLSMIGIDQAFPIEVVPACDPKSVSVFCLGMKFADGSLATLMFSAKGPTFEGIHESLNAHRGDAIVSVTDFRHSSAHIAEKRIAFRTLYRDHGHRQTLVNSYVGVSRGEFARSVSPTYTKGSARLFLGVKSAIEEGRATLVRLD